VLVGVKDDAATDDDNGHPPSGAANKYMMLLLVLVPKYQLLPCCFVLFQFSSIQVAAAFAIVL